MKKIRLTTDLIAEKNDGATSINAKPSLDNMIQKVKSASIEIDTDVLAKNLDECFTNISAALLQLKDKQESIKIDNVQFSLGISSSGEVSLLSAVNANSQTSVGITFNISFR